MKMLTILTAGLIVLVTPHFTQAQDQMAAKAATAMKIADARKANAKLMHEYSWQSRTELIENGAVKDMQLDQVQYGPDGTLQRMALNEQGASLPIGFLRRAIAEKKRKQMEDFLRGLRGLLDQYTLPTAGKVLDFMDKATATLADDGRLILMSGTGVVVPGDSLSVWTEAATRHTHKMEVNTFFQNQAVNLTATYKTLPSGLTHVDYAEVIVPGKELTVQVQNFNYERTMPPPAPKMAVHPKPSSASSSSLETVERKLKDLKMLFDKGLITQSDYDTKKAQLLEGL
jgi:hypothetical protein